MSLEHLFTYHLFGWSFEKAGGEWLSPKFCTLSAEIQLTSYLIEPHPLSNWDMRDHCTSDEQCTTLCM